MARSRKNRHRAGRSLESRLQKLPPVTRAKIERALEELAEGSTAPHLTTEASAELRRAVSSGLGDLRFKQLLLYAESIAISDHDAINRAIVLDATLPSDAN